MSELIGRDTTCLPVLARIAIVVVGALAIAVQAPPAFAEADPRWEDLDARVRPPGASAAAMAFDEARGELVLFRSSTWTRREGTWTDREPETEPTSRFGASMAYHAERAETVLFGGYVGPGESTAETWIWDGMTWRSESPDVAPIRRAFASIAYDRATQRVILFGGITRDDSGDFHRLDDTWAWDGATWTELHPENAPPPRNGAGMAFDEEREEIILFGGSGNPTPRECIRVEGMCAFTTASGTPGDLNDTWAFDGTDWTERVPEHAPPVRSDMAMAYDPARRGITLFAGVSTTGFFNDTWHWDGSDWSEIEVAEPPERRFSPAAATDRTKEEIVIFGGHRISYLGADTWAWDGETWRSLELPTPKPRFEAVMEADPGGQGVVLFGGGADSRFADTWVYDGEWTRLFPQTSPPARAGAASAFDEPRDRVVLFGGFGTDTRDLADTWTWDGQTWTDVTPGFPALSPPERRAAAMAYDVGRDEAVLFGGFNPRLAVFGDTWTWDGSGWKLKTPLRSPPPLYDAAMVYDAARDEVVMFGGLNESNELVDEMWIWDGATWTKRGPPIAPRPRSGMMMSYDPVLEKVVLFSGLGSGAPDVWTWDGAAWEELALASGPTRRAWGAFAPTDVGLLLFGGNGGGYLDDTWLLRTTPAQLQKDTILELTVEGRGQDMTLRARLTELDAPHSPIADRTIDFYSDDELIGSELSDTDGVATVAVPPAHRSANRTYEAVFDGDDFYLGSSDERSGKGKGKGGNGGGSGGNGGGGEDGRNYAGRMLLM